jgi:DNA gyrase/topoisomerase IV, subunit A
MDDDPLLQYEIEENKSVEPKWYIPILPMVLVNGAEGIGTGKYLEHSSPSLDIFQRANLVSIRLEYVDSKL